MSTLISGKHQVSVNAGPETVWQAMRDYGDLSWAQGIDEVVVEGEGIGMVRNVRLTGSEDWIQERLVARDDQAMTFSYAIDGDGMPGFANYSAHVRVEPAEGGCIIHWECRADADEGAAEGSQQMIQALAEGICSLFAARFDPAQEIA